MHRHDSGYYSWLTGDVGMPCTSGAGVGVRRALFLPKPPSNHSALSCCARFPAILDPDDSAHDREHRPVTFWALFYRVCQAGRSVARNKPIISPASGSGWHFASRRTRLEEHCFPYRNERLGTHSLDLSQAKCGYHGKFCRRVVVSVHLVFVCQSSGRLEARPRSNGAVDDRKHSDPLFAAC